MSARLPFFPEAPFNSTSSLPFRFRSHCVPVVRTRMSGQSPQVHCTAWWAPVCNSTADAAI